MYMYFHIQATWFNLTTHWISCSSRPIKSPKTSYCSLNSYKKYTFSQETKSSLDKSVILFIIYITFSGYCYSFLAIFLYTAIIHVGPVRARAVVGPTLQARLTFTIPVAVPFIQSTFLATATTPIPPVIPSPSPGVNFPDDLSTSNIVELSWVVAAVIVST